MFSEGTGKLSKTPVRRFNPYSLGSLLFELSESIRSSDDEIQRRFTLKEYNSLGNFRKIALLMPVLLSLGCANMGQVLSESNGTYHFRKTRWGYTQERVLLAEPGKRLFLRKGNALVFNHRISHIPVKIVYTFKENRLRAAGYITNQPVQGAENIIKRSVEELGEPTQILNDGMLWLDNETLVYSNAYISRVNVSNSEYKFSGGILSRVLDARGTPGVINRWDGVWAYVDQNFYKELHEVNLPLDELSFYEKLLFGVLKRNTIYTYVTGSGRLSVPQQLPTN